MVDFISLLGAVVKDIDQEKVYKAIKEQPLDEWDILQLQANGFINEEMAGQFKMKYLSMQAKWLETSKICQPGFVDSPPAYNADCDSTGCPLLRECITR